MILSMGFPVDKAAQALQNTADVTLAIAQLLGDAPPALTPPLSSSQPSAPAFASSMLGGSVSRRPRRSFENMDEEEEEEEEEEQEHEFDLPEFLIPWQDIVDEENEDDSYSELLNNMYDCDAFEVPVDEDNETFLHKAIKAKNWTLVRAFLGMNAKMDKLHLESGKGLFVQSVHKKTALDTLILMCFPQSR